MYSYEDRIRAVKLFVKLGKRVRATIRQLGYPTKNSLKAWCREFEHTYDLPVAYVRTRPRFSEEQKRVAVEHYLTHDRCIAWTIRELGYPCRATFNAWLDDLYPETRKRVVGKARGAVHPRELKQAAVIELCTRQEGALAVAQRLGVCRPTLYNWKNEGVSNFVGEAVSNSFLSSGLVEAVAEHDGKLIHGWLPIFALSEVLFSYVLQGEP
jgi:putative transposase